MINLNIKKKNIIMK